MGAGFQNLGVPGAGAWTLRMKTDGKWEEAKTMGAYEDGREFSD